MNYIILDLEWNQGNEQKEKQLKELPFEISVRQNVMKRLQAVLAAMHRSVHVYYY